MKRQNSHFLAHILLLQRSLVVKLGVSRSRSLGHIHFHPGIVQQATGRSAETKSHPITTTNLPDRKFTLLGTCYNIVRKLSLQLCCVSGEDSILPHVLLVQCTFPVMQIFCFKVIWFSHLSRIKFLSPSDKFWASTKPAELAYFTLWQWFCIISPTEQGCVVLLHPWSV
jgi:hypothetical protein